MSRTGEIVLGVISAIMTLLSIIAVTVSIIGGSSIMKEEGFKTEFQDIIANDPAFTESDLQIQDSDIDLVIDGLSIFGWIFIVILGISLILNIIGIVSISKNKNSKLAGIMFIIAGIFAGILSPTSILLYIAAIMCFVRKPPVQLQEENYTTEKQL